MHEGVEEATKDIRSGNASAAANALGGTTSGGGGTASSGGGGSGGGASGGGGVENSTSPHRRHKERKKIKCPELKYNKFQPPVYDFRDGATTSTLPATSGGGRSVSGGVPNSTGVVTGVNGPLQHSHVVETDVREIKRILRTYIGRLNDKDAQGRINKEWRVVARVLDRLFFFLYLATIIVSLATIFPRG